MRNLIKDLILFERKGIIKELYLPREIDFYAQIVNGRVRYFQDQDLVQYGIILGWGKTSYYNFLDKNADFILETKGKMNNINSVRI